MGKFLMTAGRLSVIASVLLIASAPCHAAHPVSISRTLVVVEQEEVTATIELFLEDLYLFHGLEPDASGMLSREELDRGLSLHQSFVAERFVIRDADGRVVHPDPKLRVAEQLPTDGVAVSELMTHRLVFDLSYAFSDPPEFLTFEQHFSGPNAVLPAEMQIEVKQSGGGTLLKQTLVQEEPQTVRIDWSRPLPADHASRDERRKWLEEQAQATLGISSYSSIYAFVYVEDFEVRVEVLIPLLLLEEFVTIDRTDAAFLSVTEQASLRPSIETQLRDAIKLQIGPAAPGNGVETRDFRAETSVNPVTRRCDFYGVRFTDLARPAEVRPVAMASGRVGIILSWPVSSRIESFDLTWDLFSKSVRAVKLVVIDRDVVTRATVSNVGRRKRFHWDRQLNHPDAVSTAVSMPMPERKQLQVPVISVVCLVLIVVAACLPATSRPIRARLAVTLLIGMALGSLIPGASYHVAMGYELPDDSEAAAICHQLLPQAYSAFRYRTEHDIYDALAVSTGDELLQEIYLDLLNSLKIQEQGGAVCRISEIDITEGSRSPQTDLQTPSFEYHCTWTVAGDVEHWGHIHQRKNQFSGVLTAEYMQESWKLTSLRIEAEQQLGSGTRLRQFSEE